MNIEDIVKVSEELTEQLRFRIVGWEESYGLSDIFSKSVNNIYIFYYLVFIYLFFKQNDNYF